MKRSTVFVVVLACAGLAACARDLQPQPEREPATVSFQLQNGGAAATYLYVSCFVDSKITSLANPTAPIARWGGCLCSCEQAPQCPVCGACYEGPFEVASGATFSDTWVAATVINESGCQRLSPLPNGEYRIEVPVYASQADAMAKVLPRTVTQVFTVPAPNDTVAIPIAAPPEDP